MEVDVKELARVRRTTVSGLVEDYLRKAAGAISRRMALVDSEVFDHRLARL